MKYINTIMKWSKMKELKYLEKLKRELYENHIITNERSASDFDEGQALAYGEMIVIVEKIILEINKEKWKKEE